MLTEEDKRRVIEEENLREEIRKKKKSDQQSKTAVTCLVVIGLVVAVAVFGSKDSDKYFKGSSSSTSSISTEEKEILFTDYANRYCLDRHDSYRSYGLLTLSGSILSYDPSKGKLGKELKTIDCRNIINAISSTVDWTQGNVAKQTMEDIILSKYWIGMKELQLVTSLGSPNDKNTSTTSSITRTQYVYDGGIKTLYIYVENGVVTSFQD